MPSYNRIWHDYDIYVHRTSQVNKTTCCQEDNVTSIAELVSVYLRFDVDFGGIFI